MTTVYVMANGQGRITGVYAGPQSGAALMDDQLPAVQKFLRDPMGLEDAFPVLDKWQLWLTALEMEPPLTKSQVYGAIFELPLTETQKEAVRIMLEDVTQYRREDPRVNLLGQAMGLTPVELDTLWHWAAQMEPPSV